MPQNLTFFYLFISLFLLFLEKQTKKMKKKGICAFFRWIGKTIKRCTLHCYVDDILPPIPCDDPADLQPGLSGLEWALSIDPCPSGVELTINTNPADPEAPLVSGPSSLEVTSDSDQTDSEPSLVPGPSSLDLKLTLDSSLSKLVSETRNVPVPSSLDVTPVPSLSSIEMNPDMDPTEPRPSPVSGPSTLDSEIAPVPGPSGFEAAVGKSTVIFNLLLGFSFYLLVCSFTLMPNRYYAPNLMSNTFYKIQHVALHQKKKSEPQVFLGIIPCSLD